MSIQREQLYEPVLNAELFGTMRRDECGPEPDRTCAQSAQKLVYALATYILKIAKQLLDIAQIILCIDAKVPMPHRRVGGPGENVYPKKVREEESISEAQKSNHWGFNEMSLIF